MTLEVSDQLPSGHVEIRLAGQEPSLVYVEERQQAEPAAPDDGMTARISLRLPEALKTAIDAAAAREGHLRQHVARPGAEARRASRKRPQGLRQRPDRVRRGLATRRGRWTSGNTYPDYVKLIGDRRPPKHDPTVRVRKPQRHARMAAMRREAFPVEGPVALVVRAPAGVVEIDATDVSEAVVELEALRDSAEGPVHDAIVELRPGSDRAELLVDIQHGFRVGGRRGPRLSIVFGQGPSIRAGIRVPAGSSVEVVSEAADVNATGRYDRAEVKTAAGDVRLDEVEGDVRVKCVSGDVTLGTVGGEANVNSISGDATIGSVAGSAELHSVSGDIELREAEAPSRRRRSPATCASARQPRARWRCSPSPAT